MGPHASGADERPPLTAQALGAMWPEVRDRLHRSLRRSGVSEDAVDEALAEVAARALARRLPAGSPDDFCRWAFVVARNLLIDATRGGARTVSLAELPDRGDCYDVGEHVASRQQLRATVRAFGRLSHADQEAIRSAIVPPGRPGRGVLETTREAVRRHRARARLRGVVGVPAALWVRFRPVPWAGTSGSRIANLGPLAAPLLLVTTTMFLVPSTWGGGAAQAESPWPSAALVTPLPPMAAQPEPAPPGASRRPGAAPTPSSPARVASDGEAPAARPAVKGGFLGEGGQFEETVEEAPDVRHRGSTPVEVRTDWLPLLP